MTRVAVIGLGGMGSRIAQRLLGASAEVTVWNRTAARALPLLERGASPADTPAGAASVADVVITMVTDAAALRAVTEGRSGVAAGARPGATVIEMSTVGPAAVARLAAALPAGVGMLDAPVLGSLGEAETGALTIFVGGDDELAARWAPLLRVLGEPRRVGPLGSGAAAKLVANATLFAVVTALGEALLLARALGLSTDVAYDVLAATPLAAQAERRRAAIDEGTYAPRFPLRLARKDADLVGAAHGDLRLAAAVRAWLADAEAAGLGDLDYTAVLAMIVGGAPTVGGATPPYDGLVIDLDGVVWRGAQPIPGAADAIAGFRRSGVRVVFLTNDPASTREQQAARLRRMGVQATAEDVVTSGSATGRLLASRAEVAASPVLVVGSAALRDEIAAAGLDAVAPGNDRRPAAVVVGGHGGFDYAELTAATRAVLAGAELYATGRDTVYPGDDGPLPATGAIVAAIETASGASATTVGKPEPYIFELAREALAGCTRVAVVGDNLASDVAGAKRAGLAAILVLTGNATADAVAAAAVQPDLVVPRLADLAP